MAGARAVPLEWLQGSPFTSYFVPSVVLFVVVGGVSLAAAVLVFRNSPFGRHVSQFAGLVLLSWIVVQVAIIGFVSWLQPASALAAMLILLMSARLRTVA